MRGRLKDMIHARARGQVLICAVCVFVNEDESVHDAVVMVNGVSACIEHAAYIRGGALEDAITLVRRVSKRTYICPQCHQPTGKLHLTECRGLGFVR